MPRAPKKEFRSTNELLETLANSLRSQALKPNIRGYKPHAKQIKFHSSPAKGKLYIGGNRSGKTTGGVAEDIFWLTGRHPYRNTPPPPVAGRIVSVDFLNGVEKIVRPELARWLPPSELLGGSWTTAYNKELRTLNLENGSFVEFMSYDQDLDKFAGTSRDFVHFDEEPPQDVFLENKTRLIDRGGSYWITMTPVEGMTWVYDDIYMPGKSGQDPNLAVVEVDMTENPYLLQNEVEEFVSGLSADDKEARVHGKFVQLGGLIFKHFNPEVHVIDFQRPPLDWEWYASLDAGYNNPTAWLWHAVSPDERVITFAEHYEAGLTIDVHAAAVHAKNQELGRAPDIYIADPSVRNSDPITGTSIQQEYVKFGIPVLLGNNDVPAGINRMARYLEVRGDNKPSWLITRNCSNLINELQRYRWKTYANKKAQRENNAKEQPHKKNDHAVDSARYFFMSRPELGPNRYSPVPNSNPLGLGELRDPRIVPVALEEEETKWKIESADEYMGIW